MEAIGHAAYECIAYEYGGLFLQDASSTFGNISAVQSRLSLFLYKYVENKNTFDVRKVKKCRRLF